MKLSQAQQFNKQHQLKSAHLMRNPDDRQQWFVTLNTKSGQRFFLADEEGEVMVEGDLQKLFDVLKSLGFSMAKISF